jgi:hypothetical protein
VWSVNWGCRIQVRCDAHDHSSHVTFTNCRHNSAVASLSVLNPDPSKHKTQSDVPGVAYRIDDCVMSGVREIQYMKERKRL